MCQRAIVRIARFRPLVLVEIAINSVKQSVEVPAGKVSGVDVILQRCTYIVSSLRERLSRCMFRPG